MARTRLNETDEGKKVIDNEGNENVAETDFYSEVALDAEQAKSVVQIEMVDPVTEQQQEGADGQTAEAAEGTDGDPPGPMAAAEGDDKPGS